MKRIIFLLLFWVYPLLAISQITFPKERIVVIADLKENKAIATNYSEADLYIESKIIKAFQLKEQKIVLKNPIIINEKGKGWFLFYEFESENAIGLYKEQLNLINSQLVITESRNAQMGLATNCKKLEFTKPPQGCKCIVLENPSLNNESSYRVFSSTR